jgi:hypothetical protein
MDVRWGTLHTTTKHHTKVQAKQRKDDAFIGPETTGPVLHLILAVQHTFPFLPYSLTQPPQSTRKNKATLMLTR